MFSTQEPHVDAALDFLKIRLPALLGDKLVGLYLFGSLTYDAFDPDISDIDLVAAITEPLIEADYAVLETMHAELVQLDPQWDNRIEVLYAPLHTLQTFRTESTPIGVISPGEPLHEVMAGREWLVNWYMAREAGITLYGHPPEQVIPPISHTEFIHSIRDHMVGWGHWIDRVDSHPYQSYTILTMCRTLYTLRHGEQVSKRKAAEWAAAAYPQWADLIGKALEWREMAVKNRSTLVEQPSMLAQTRAFVHFVSEQVLGDNSPSSTG